MPLYEYLCTNCGERTEVLQRLGAAPLTQCPRCGGALERLISAPALQFKGTGWYVTDYAKRGTTPASPPAEKDKSEKAADSKPANKPSPSDNKAKAG